MSSISSTTGEKCFFDGAEIRRLGTPLSATAVNGLLVASPKLTRDDFDERLDLAELLPRLGGTWVVEC